MAKTVEIDPDELIDFNVVPHTPCFFIVRSWLKPPGATLWNKLPDLESPDGEPVHRQLNGVVKGTDFDFWIGVGGKPRAPFRLTATVAQGGRVLPNGSILCEGVLSAEGAGMDEEEFDFV